MSNDCCSIFFCCCSCFSICGHSDLCRLCLFCSPRKRPTAEDDAELDRQYNAVLQEQQAERERALREKQYTKTPQMSTGPKGHSPSPSRGQNFSPPPMYTPGPGGHPSPDSPPEDRRRGHSPQPSGGHSPRPSRHSPRPSADLRNDEAHVTLPNPYDHHQS
jgi:hypothetical protein